MNCFILLDHFSDGIGSLMLYFHELNQIVRVPIPNGKVKAISNLSDDRVLLMRVPDKVGA